jgi:hypothetical protein
MEGIVSLLIFTLLIAAVTLMLNWSLRETSATIREGNATQEVADAALLDDYTAFTPVSGASFTLTVTQINGADPATPIGIPIDGITTTTFGTDEFVAFFPPTPSPSTTPP